MVKRGGNYVQGGMGKADITFPIMALCAKEVTAKGSFRYSAGDYKLAIELVRSGRVDVKKLISKVVEFSDAEEAFKEVKAGQVIKVLIAGLNDEGRAGQCLKLASCKHPGDGKRIGIAWRRNWSGPEGSCHNSLKVSGFFFHERRQRRHSGHG